MFGACHAVYYFRWGYGFAATIYSLAASLSFVMTVGLVLFVFNGVFGRDRRVGTPAPISEKLVTLSPAAS